MMNLLLQRALRLCLVMSCLIPIQAFASLPSNASLFFTHDEEQQINAMEAKSESQESHDGDIELGAIMYYGANNWTIWLQGARWTPQSDQTAVQIVSVNPEEVRVRLPGVDHEIMLKAHQTYQIATGKIIEGSR